MLELVAWKRVLDRSLYNTIQQSSLKVQDKSLAANTMARKTSITVATAIATTHSCGHKFVPDIYTAPSPQKPCKTCDRRLTTKRIEDEVSFWEGSITVNKFAAERLFAEFEMALDFAECESDIKRVTEIHGQWVQLDVRIQMDEFTLSIIPMREQCGWEDRWSEEW